jgi:hypothetical protein
MEFLPLQSSIELKLMMAYRDCNRTSKQARGIESMVISDNSSSMMPDIDLCIQRQNNSWKSYSTFWT